MNEILISIIIPIYNREHLILDTLQSLIEQSFTNWECIIVDDRSTDDTVKKILDFTKDDSRFHVLVRPSELIKGSSSSRNFGFTKAKGKYVHWMDSDDIYSKDALKNYLSQMTNDVDVCIAPLEKFNFEDMRSLGFTTIISSNLIEDYFIGQVTFYVSGPFWKKAFLSKQDYLFDEKISNLDDWDFNLRMLYSNPTIKYYDKSLIRYRIHEDSLSKEISKLNFREIESEFFAREKHYKLLFKKSTNDLKKINHFLANRSKYLLREQVVVKQKNIGYLYKKAVKYFYKMNNFHEIFKISAAMVLFCLFNKGYRLLK